MGCGCGRGNRRLPRTCSFGPETSTLNTTRATGTEDSVSLTVGPVTSDDGRRRWWENPVDRVTEGRPDRGGGRGFSSSVDTEVREGSAPSTRRHSRMPRVQKGSIVGDRGSRVGGRTLTGRPGRYTGCGPNPWAARRVLDSLFTRRLLHRKVRVATMPNV